MSEKIKIDIVSDVVCPWCIVGYKRLQRAITELQIEDRVEIEWHPFELNPNMPAEGQEIVAHLNEKYGSTPEQIEGSLQHLTNLGAELDFEFDYFKGMRMLNTREAHLLLDFAKENGKQTELNLRLVSDFFTNRKDISDRAVLLEAIKDVGLDADKALAILNDKNKLKDIIEKEEAWRRSGVNSVPTIIVADKEPVIGAQAISVFKDTLNRYL
ncbi:DsbA family oxidoreductase [Saccharicrinis aurantiacus]|uniref:DsbA family oxidoreductase n=1 Tax=Saccharicrinis aurantiacus TaxID=1849719 RepID=UPI0024902E64|nr:DsbA family oxidoreductase [Saccharicrinis aurantiacus]